MWRIMGVDKVTGREVEVAIATNEAERKEILRQERGNYLDLRAVRVRVAA